VISLFCDITTCEIGQLLEAQLNDTPASPAAGDDIRETRLPAVAGRLLLPVSAVGLAVAVALVGLAVRSTVHGGGGLWAQWLAAVVLAVLGSQTLRGLTRIAPGEAVVAQLFGRYLGTLRNPGLWWITPVATRRRVATTVRTHQSQIVKVNDADGRPVELAMVLTWRVADTARALFTVEDIDRFVAGQCAMALRHMAAQHRYQCDDPAEPSLATSGGQVTAELAKEVRQRLEPAGVAVTDSQLTHIAYAPEIAQVMLRRQEAAAIVAARQQIVDGAVGMVELALDRLESQHVVDLDEERKAAMVGNLLVVLCSDHATQPMINAGSLYL
jgi:regulator of protease activity HflC (stomatin/prohibitin superfamily)